MERGMKPYPRTAVGFSPPAGKRVCLGTQPGSTPNPVLAGAWRGSTWQPRAWCQRFLTTEQDAGRTVTPVIGPAGEIQCYPRSRSNNERETRGDIASFFYCMGPAAAQVAPHHNQPLPVLTPEHLADVPTFGRNYFRELYHRLPGNGAVVLDNDQDAPEVSVLHDVLLIAMSEVPRGRTFMVLSRVEPSATPAILRLREHAACVDWANLRLTPAETIWAQPA